MYNDIDLVAGEGSQMNKWVTSAFRTLFTKEEILAGYVCEENSKSGQQQNMETNEKCCRQSMHRSQKS